MKKKPGTQDQFLCKKGEKVTFTFTANGTVFSVTREFDPAKATDPDIVDGKLVFRIAADPASGDFTSATSVAVLIVYEFKRQGGSYDVKITGSLGGAFSRNISQDESFDNTAERTYRFFLDD